MINTHTRIPLLALLATLAASGPASALAKTNHTRTTHGYTATLRSALLATENRYPNPAGVAWEAGDLKSRPFGDGSVWDRVTITGHPAPDTLSFRGIEADYLPGGRVSGTFTGTASVQADGSQTVAVTGRNTGGSGRYRGATGHYRFSGTIASGSSVLTGRSTGSISY